MEKKQKTSKKQERKKAWIGFQAEIEDRKAFREIMFLEDIKARPLFGKMIKAYKAATK